MLHRYILCFMLQNDLKLKCINLPCQVVQEEIAVPASFVKLSYLSSRAPGYKSLLRIVMAHGFIPTGLVKVHLMIAIEGRLFQKWFPARPDLVYTFTWNKTDVYGQKVSGLAQVEGRLTLTT